MRFFGKDDNDVKTAEYEEITDVNDSPDVPEEPVPEAVPETAQAQEEVPQPYIPAEEPPAPVTETVPLPEPPVSVEEEVVSAVEQEIPDEEILAEEPERVPVGKYNLDKLYKEIGEDYCKVHSLNPESDFSEKVGIVNAIKRQSEEMRDQLNTLCRSPWMLLMILLLSATIVLPILADFSPKTISVQIPQMVIDLGLILIFFSALARRVTKVGFTLINIVLTIYMIVCLIPVVTFLILGIFMKLRGDVSYSTLSTSLIVFAVIFGLISILFYGGLKRTTVAARTVAGGGLVQIKSSFIVTVIVFLAMVFNMAALVMMTIFKTATTNMLQDFVKQADQYFKQANLSEAISISLNYNPEKEMYIIAAAVVNILLMIVVMVILSKIRNKDKVAEEIEEEEE